MAGGRNPGTRWIRFSERAVVALSLLGIAFAIAEAAGWTPYPRWLRHVFFPSAIVVSLALWASVVAVRRHQRRER